jgi:cephalosporin hydroxylase
MGRPIIQLPDDAFRMQELIYRVKPDVIVETGIAHGGSLIFYASICKSMDKGRIIGVDVEIRSHNRKAIEAHELFPLITMIEGDSTSANTVDKVKSLVAPGERVMVILDSCHSKQHVLAELNAYSGLVSVDSYIVAMDGVMQEVAGGPRTGDDWSWNNPKEAALEFVEANPAFQIEQPSFVFNEGSANSWPTYSPNGVIKRLR